MSKTFVHVSFSDDGLWGSTDPEVEGYDARASARKFETMLEKALKNTFRRAEISIEHGINDFHRVDGASDSNDAEVVGEIINRVWSGWKWLVKS